MKKKRQTYPADDRRAPDGALRYLMWRWRHRRCPNTESGHHLWLYAGATTNPQTGRPYPYDRQCQACGIED